MCNLIIRSVLILLCALSPWLVYAESTAMKLRQSLPDQKQTHQQEYELVIYRLPGDYLMAKNLCKQRLDCQVRQNGPYTFYAFSSKFDQIEQDILRLKINQLQQYMVAGNYQLNPGKYFTVGFKKSGEFNGNVLFEDISLAVKPVQEINGLLNVDVFGFFKYHLLGNGLRPSDKERMVAFKTSVSESKNFFLIAEVAATQNEPAYLAMIRQCGTIRYASPEIKVLEKSL